MEENTTLICQSCSMPLSTDEDKGGEADGGKSDKYCKYCYQGGAFTDPDATLDGMVATLTQMAGDTSEEAVAKAKGKLSGLERWAA